MADVSVIIAAHNVEKYIERAIRSALEQQNVQVEIIVIDDASTDNTIGVVERIADARIKLLCLNQNSGPSVARNAGFAAATAPWIAILDGDDAFAPNRLRTCLDRTQKAGADIVIDLIQANRESDGAHYPMLRAADFGKRDKLDLPTFIKGNMSFLGGASLGYVKPIFAQAFLRKNNLGYDASIKIGEDYLLLAEALACSARCVIEPSYGYHYTIRAGSISHRLSEDNIQRMIAGDERFAARHTLDPASKLAQKWRGLSLNEALAFTRLVNAIKAKNASAAWRVIMQRPTAAIHLWRPCVARLQRLFA